MGRPPLSGPPGPLCFARSCRRFQGRRMTPWMGEVVSGASAADPGADLPAPSLELALCASAADPVPTLPRPLLPARLYLPHPWGRPPSLESPGILAIPGQKPRLEQRPRRRSHSGSDGQSKAPPSSCRRCRWACPEGSRWARLGGPEPVRGTGCGAMRLSSGRAFAKLRACQEPSFDARFPRLLPPACVRLDLSLSQQAEGMESSETTAC